MIDDIEVNEQLRKILIRLEDLRLDISRKGHPELSHRMNEIQTDLRHLQNEIAGRRKGMWDRR